jgi:capsid assembly protease
MHFLISADALSALQDAARLPTAPTAADRAAYLQTPQARPMRSAGSVAHIDVRGILTPQPDLLAMLFGGGNTTYPSIRDALSAAAADPTVERVVMNVDSPGGTVDGLFETLAAVEAFQKPITVRASRATSAAYAIAAAAGPIEATTSASSFGSIGVATALFTDGRVVDITNRESPDKRPDVRTPEGRGVVQDHLDDIYTLFVEAIARGRNVSTDRVAVDFGRGRVLLSRDALRLGMVDSIASAPTDAGSARAVADAAKAKMKAVADGRIAARPGESREQFSARVAACSLGQLLGEQDHAVRGDLGDQIVALIENGHTEYTAPPEAFSGDLGDEIVRRMEGGQ